MNVYLAELTGTAVLVLLGNGVVANVVLSRTKGNDGGWIVVSAGWGFAVFVAVLCVDKFSGAHINPAVTLGKAIAGSFPWLLVPGYMTAQIIGGFLGAVLVYVFYHSHYQVTDDGDAKLATFCTLPAIRAPWRNLFCEVVGTFVLVLAVLLAVGATVTVPAAQEPLSVGLGAVGALPVGLVVFAIGLSLGGTTGYAINPARDFGPRLAHAVLPVPAKRDNDWSYSWIPVVGPLAGAAVAALFYRLAVVATP